MHLSKLSLNVRHPSVMRAFADVYLMHQLIWRAFPNKVSGGPGRVLFRVEPARSGQREDRVLVQSEKEPDWEPLCDSRMVCCTQSKEIKPAFTFGMRLQFLLKANPTIVRTFAPQNGEAEPKKKRVGLYREAEQRAWLTGEWTDHEAPPPFIARRDGKAQQAGICVEDLLIIAPGKEFGRKPDGTIIEFQAVEYHGTLSIENADVFALALENGIGSAKGFGFGLLSLARA